MLRLTRRLPLTLSLITLVWGCASGPVSQSASIDGSVLYHERIALPPGASVTVSLLDVSRMDVAAATVATTTFEAVGGPPYAFILNYDPAAAEPPAQLSLRAWIHQGDTLLFTTDQHYPPPADGPVELRVKQVVRSQTSRGDKPDAPVTNTRWVLLSLHGEAVTTGAGGREVYLQLGPQAQTAHGYSGCNRFTGTYSQADQQLTFGQMASTRMACAEGMLLEDRFLKLLNGSMRFSISGDHLTLRNDLGASLAVFEARYLTD